MVCLLSATIPRLLVGGVPNGHDLGAVKDALLRAGFCEPGVQYEVSEVNPVSSPASLVGKLRQDSIERITYDDLVGLAEEEL